jgi:ethanolamine utilization microcompartment shell protein EutS
MIHPFSTDFEEPTPAERRNGYVVCAAAAVNVSNTPMLQAALAAAQPGDVITLADGNYANGGINLNKTGVTVAAQNIGKATLSGGQVRLAGTDNAIKGVIVTGARTNWDTAAVVVEGTGGTLEDVTAIDNESAGFDFHGCTNAKATRIKAIHNGSMGITSGDVNGRSVATASRSSTP